MAQYKHLPIYKTTYELLELANAKKQQFVSAKKVAGLMETRLKFLKGT